MQQDQLSDLRYKVHDFESILMQIVDLDRIPQKQVESHAVTIEIHGLLFIILFALCVMGLQTIMDQVRAPIQNLLKDTSLLMPFLLVILTLNYNMSAKHKEWFNFYGVFDYVDLDKMNMQIVLFSLLWFIIGVIYIYIWDYQTLVYEEYENQDIHDLHRTYENMYLYSDPLIGSTQKKIQYHSIRQEFIGSLRSDFDFGTYLSKNQLKIYKAIMRINSFSAIMVIVVSILDLKIEKWIPVLITILLFIFKLVQDRNVYLMYTKINTPYQFRYNAGLQRQELMTTAPYNKFSIGKFLNKKRQIIVFPAWNIRLLHGVLFMQVFWISWLLYERKYTHTLYDYTSLSISIALTAINLTLIIPNIINSMTVTHLIYSIQKATMEQQYRYSLVYEKALHYLRAIQFNPDEQDEQAKLYQSQKCILKQGFMLLLRTDYDLKEKLMEKRKQLEANPELLMPEETPPSFDMNDKPSSEHSVQYVKPKQLTIDEALNNYENELHQQMNQISEDSKIDISMLSKLSKIIGGNLPMWYLILMMRCYFNIGATGSVTFAQLIRYCEFNQYQIENPKQIYYLNANIEDLETNLLQEDYQLIMKDLKYHQRILDSKAFTDYLLDMTLCLPK